MLRARAIFLELKSVEVRSPSSVIPVTLRRAARKELLQILVSLPVDTFKDEPEHPNISSSLQWSKIVIKESLLWRQTNLLQEMRL